jgi:hypothetical protein
VETDIKLDELILTEIRHATFCAVSVNLNPDWRRNQLALSYRVCLKEGITLSSGEKSENLDCRISVIAETNELKNEFVEKCRTLRQRPGQKAWGLMSFIPEVEFGQEAIGLMSYFPDDLHPGFAQCVVNVLVPKVTFDGLFTAARLGHLPGEISVNVQCMQGGKWDNKTFAELPVTSIAFGEIPLAAHTVKDGFVQVLTNPDEFFPPTRSQVSELLEKLDVVAIRIKGVLLAVLGIGALILILRFFK